MPDAARKAAVAAVGETLAKNFPPEGFGLLGAYWPFRREFNCIPFVRKVLAAGGQVALPVVVQPRSPLEFRPWTPQARMELGVWDIPFPADGPAVKPEAFVIPLVGFNDAGYRLGYGAGYYDRTLATYGENLPLRIAVGFEFQRLPEFEAHPHDIPMDYVITEAGMFRCPASSR
jgi:5-formyltetrahydrofolate cyclo-ligase